MAIKFFGANPTCEELQKIIDCSGDPIVAYNKDGLAWYVNPAFERVFGWKSEELLGKRIDFIPENSKEQTLKAVKDVIAGKMVSGMETIRKTKNRQNIHIRLSANALKSDDGQYNGMVVTLQNITELVLSRQKALEADRAKQDFLSNISHEIRTPVNGLLGVLDLLENTVLNREQTEFVDILKSSSGALMSVISDLLDFSKIDSGQIEYSVIDFDLRTTVEEVKNEIIPRVDKKGLQTIFFVHEQVPSLLRGDPERLRQILIHLLENAVKFTEKGEVKVSVGCSSQSPTDAILTFEVADTGVGIKKDQLETIFNSFSQADATATRKYGGVGIGLSISNQLVHLMGGKINVKSTPGKGSLFGFALQFEKQQVDTPVAVGVPQSIKHKRVLVVDDDAANRAILKESLKRWGSQFEEVVNGDRALEKLDPLKKSQKQFDIVLIAMQMSGMNGESLARKIRGIPKLAETCLIMLSAQGKRGDVERLGKIGVEGYLPMPVDPSLLFDCMTTALAMQSEGSKKIITRHFLRESKKQQFHIVLVEPTLVNRKIINKVLNQAGYMVQVVQNKDQAIKILQKIGYAVVLVDSDSPEPEILKILKEIQNVKKQENSGEIVIIVMTDHGLKKDEETIADDYILKPLDSQSLSKLVEKWVKVLVKKLDRKIPQSLPGKQLKPQTGVFNYPAAIERAMDDKPFLEMLLNEFIKTLPEKISQIKAFIQQKNFESVTQHSHSLRGSALNIGADEISAVALKFENNSDLGDIKSMQDNLIQLENECQKFEAYINTLDWGNI